MMNNDESKEAPSNELRCDYLVVGAGAAGMAFVDTLLTEDPTCRVVLVDRRAKAGGHWVDSYPFVRLHQPSHYYGVNSLPLGKARDAKGRECFDRDDLASGAEVVAYYEKVLAQFEASGRVDIRLETSYEARGARALLTTNDGTTSWVTPRKTVTTISNVQVPSTRPPPFPVADGVECRPEKCHPAATMFVLKSRLFDAAPMHHGGLLKFLWAMLGPTLALKAKGKKFLRKVDAGGLSDVPDSFGLGRPLPAKKRGAVRKVKGPKNYPPKRAPRWAPCGCGAPVAAPAK